MAFYPVPPNSMLVNFHQNLCKHLEKTVKKKLRDASTLKSSISNPHNREIIVPNISRLVFCSVYGRILDSNEINRAVIKPSARNSPLFELRNLARLNTVFNPESLVKVHSAGDVSLITSWLVLKERASVIVDELEVNFQPGRLVIPLSRSNDVIKVFIPCGGPDPETDQLPSWCKQYKLDDIVPVKPQQLHYVQGDGFLSGIAKQDWSSLNIGQQVNVGDYVMCRGDYLVVKGVGVDFNSNAKSIVRFENDFKKNINKQKYQISSMPILHGLCIDMSSRLFENEKLVSMILNKIDDDDIGILNISFRNACFNVLGFLTHDIAISGF